MRLTLATGLCGMTLVACGEPARPRSPTRTADEIVSEHKARLREAFARGEREVVWIDCSHPRKPRDAECGVLYKQLLSRERLASFQASRCQDVADDECVSRVRADFLAQLDSRYPLARIEAVATECTVRNLDCSMLWARELAMMSVHNAAVRARADAEAEAIIQSAREKVLEHNRQVESEERKRAEDAAAWQALAAGLAGAARGMSNGLNDNTSSGRPPASTYVPQPSYTATAPGDCSSDYQCGFGNVCVKSEGRMAGSCARGVNECARGVNEYGNPTFQHPRPNFGPGGPGQCSFDTECPVGFRCRKDGGALTGNCMK